MTRPGRTCPTPGCSLPPSDHEAVPEPPGSEPSPLLPLRVPPEAWQVAGLPCAPPEQLPLAWTLQQPGAQGAAPPLTPPSCIRTKP